MPSLHWSDQNIEVQDSQKCHYSKISRVGNTKSVAYGKDKNVDKEKIIIRIRNEKVRKTFL